MGKFRDEIERVVRDINEVERFVDKEYFTIRHMLQNIGYLWEFNMMNGTNISFDVEDLLSFVVTDKGRKRISFFTYDNVNLSIDLDEENDKLLSKLRLEPFIGSAIYDINYLSKYGKEKLSKFTILELGDIGHLFRSYMLEMYDRLYKHSSDGSLETVFQNIIKDIDIKLRTIQAWEV